MELTREKILAMEPRQLNQMAAIHVMGWIPSWGNWWLSKEECGQFNCSLDKVSGWSFEHPKGVEYRGKKYCSTSTINWEPSGSIEHAFKVEEKIKELDLESRYVEELLRLVTASYRENWSKMTINKCWFAYIHATPKQRCKAALLATLEV